MGPDMAGMGLTQLRDKGPTRGQNASSTAGQMLCHRRQRHTEKEPRPLGHGEARIPEAPGLHPGEQRDPPCGMGW